jgi:type I restriction enzyme S subunit
VTTAQAAPGDEWFGSLPSGWDFAPLRYLVRSESGATPDKSKHDYWAGDIPWISPKDMKVESIGDSEDHVTELALQNSSLTKVSVGSVLLVVRGMILAHSVPVALTTASVTINQDMKALTCSGRLEPRFLKAVIQGAKSWFLANAGESSHGTKKLETEVIGRFLVPLPPLRGQRAIADYLDRETARLDALVAAKERVLGLLAEKRRALITRAVTRGLDPRAPLRDSGIPWLGEIPAHWETRRAAWLFRERDERGETALPLLEVSINAGVVLREFSDERIESTAADFNTYKVARQGDVAFNKMRMWQGAVGVAPQDGLVSPDYVVAEPTGELSSEYAGLLFRTEMFSAECARRSHGIVWDRLRLYWEGFREIELPLPSAEAQREIVSHIARETTKLDAVRQATDRSVALLKERRAALIAAAVTGLIDASHFPASVDLAAMERSC